MFRINVDHRHERDMYQGTTSAGSLARAGFARAGVQSRAEQPSGCVYIIKKALGFSLMSLTLRIFNMASSKSAHRRCSVSRRHAEILCKNSRVPREMNQ